jgi:hypothetical protein
MGTKTKPFRPKKDEVSATCALGDVAYYAINLSDAAIVASGVCPARDNNLHLIIKNTGHDALGRPTDQGFLALWTQNIKKLIASCTTRVTKSTGPDVRIGAGIRVQELYEAATAKGYRAIGGICDSGALQKAGYSLPVMGPWHLLTGWVQIKHLNSRW